LDRSETSAQPVIFIGTTERSADGSTSYPGLSGLSGFPPTRQLILFPKKNKMNYLFANNQSLQKQACSAQPQKALIPIREPSQISQTQATITVNIC